MSYKSAKRTRLLAKKATLETQLTNADNALTELLKTENKEYRFDDGEGSQRVERRDVDSARKTVQNLEAELDYVCRQLAGLGLVSIKARRKKYNDGVYGGRY